MQAARGREPNSCGFHTGVGLQFAKSFECCFLSAFVILKTAWSHVMMVCVIPVVPATLTRLIIAVFTTPGSVGEEGTNGR